VFQDVYLFLLDVFRATHAKGRKDPSRWGGAGVAGRGKDRVEREHGGAWAGAARPWPGTWAAGHRGEAGGPGRAAHLGGQGRGGSSREGQVAGGFLGSIFSFLSTRAQTIDPGTIGPVEAKLRSYPPLFPICNNRVNFYSQFTHLQ
jgi:hypothetical protein